MRVYITTRSDPVKVGHHSSARFPDLDWSFPETLTGNDVHMAWITCSHRNESRLPCWTIADFIFVPGGFGGYYRRRTNPIFR